MNVLLASSLVLFADADPASWTTKEVLALVGGILAAVIPITIRAFKHLTKTQTKRIKELEGSVEGLEKKLAIRDDNWVSPGAAHTIAALQVKVSEEKHQAEMARIDAEHAREAAKAQVKNISQLKEAVEAALAQTQGQLALALASVAQKDEAIAKGDTKLAEANYLLANANAEIEAGKKGDKKRNAILKKTLDLEGKIWTQDVLTGTPDFLALNERRTPIISLLNLKGGVGKTTLASYLAWGLARRGYRLLLVDLDLQGSLSSLFLPGTELKKRDEDGLALRHFFARAAKENRPQIRDFAVRVDHLGGAANLVATSDKLAYEELNLTFQWLLRIGGTAKQWNGRRDVRMLLRKALHRRGLKKHYDLVLLDCPPLINLSCVNALAASDFVLIPVTPSRKSIERVPPLLARLEEIQGKVNKELAILGLVANRTQWKESMTPVEKKLWDSLPQICLDVMHQSAYRFVTFMPQRTLIRDAESDFPPRDDADILTRVDELAREIEGRLPQACHRGPANGKGAEAVLEKKGGS